MKITDAQSRLISYLIEEASRAPEDFEHRWRKATRFVRHYSEEKLLLLSRDLTEDVVLSPDGEIRIVYTEVERLSRIATEHEARMALFMSIEYYPELLSLLPPRPAQATICKTCEGTGIGIQWRTNPAYRHVVCNCGGAGWIIDPTKEQ